MLRPRNGKILGVLFDWDGTLLNSYEADSAAYLAMFQEMGVAWGLEDLARHYSPNWYDVYRAAGLPESRWSAADLLLQAVFGGIYALLLTDIFFFLESSMPFTRPRTPGLSSVPLT